MQKRLIDILTLLEKAIPPPEQCHHALMVTQYGSDQRLVLQVNRAGMFYPCFLNEDELEQSPTAIVDAIVDLLKRV